MGDGNAGAANVAQQVGFLAGAVVAAADTSKGIAAVLIVRQGSHSEVVALLAGLAAVLGHNWSPLLHFQGGRGAATTLGVMMVLLTKELSILLAIASLPFALSRNTTLAFAILFAPLSLLAWRFGEPSYLVAYSVAIPVLVGVTHWGKTHSQEARVEAGKVLRGGNGC